MRNFDDVWEADLMDMRSLKSYNDSYSYVLIVIDVISKYAWVEPVKDKTSRNVADPFTRVLTRSNGRKPICPQTDKGKEFVGDVMQKNLWKHGITYRVTRSRDTKAAIVSRLRVTPCHCVCNSVFRQGVILLIKILEGMLMFCRKS